MRADVAPTSSPIVVHLLEERQETTVAKRGSAMLRGRRRVTSFKQRGCVGAHPRVRPQIKHARISIRGNSGALIWNQSNLTCLCSARCATQVTRPGVNPSCRVCAEWGGRRSALAFLAHGEPFPRRCLREGTSGSDLSPPPRGPVL